MARSHQMAEQILPLKQTDYPQMKLSRDSPNWEPMKELSVKCRLGLTAFLQLRFLLPKGSGGDFISLALLRQQPGALAADSECQDPASHGKSSQPELYDLAKEG